MTHDGLLAELWTTTLKRLGGEAAVTALARETRAFLRPREIKSAVDLLRIILAYCLGGMGLRSSSTWAAHGRRRSVWPICRMSLCCSDCAIPRRGQSVDGAAGRTPAGERCDARNVGGGPEGGPGAARGRRVRLVDSTSVAKASVKLRQACGLWRIHAVFDLPAERFSFFELTDEKGAESLSRMAIAPGDILIADRGYCRPTLLQA